jgi:hypothetical protein
MSGATIGGGAITAGAGAAGDHSMLWDWEALDRTIRRGTIIPKTTMTMRGVLLTIILILIIQGLRP